MRVNEFTSYLTALLDPQFSDNYIMNGSRYSIPMVVLPVIVEFDLWIDW